MKEIKVNSWLKHREDGPAVEYLTGTKEWFINGLAHREDGPAKEYSSGSKEWFINNVLHRTGGPAREMSDGLKEWWVEGKFHREDGPAGISNTTGKTWALDGKLLFSTLILDINTNHPMKLSMDLRNKVVLSKKKHPKYPTVKIWKILDDERISELIIIPGMEEYITQ